MHDRPPPPRDRTAIGNARAVAALGRVRSQPRLREDLVNRPRASPIWEEIDKDISNFTVSEKLQAGAMLQLLGSGRARVGPYC